MTIAICIAFVLLICGVALVEWAIYNPRWQSADAYDAYGGPLILGGGAILAATVIASVTAIAWLIQGHLHS